MSDNTRDDQPIYQGSTVKNNNAKKEPNGKNAFEIRLELLELAFSIAQNSVDGYKDETGKVSEYRLSDGVIYRGPTTDDVIKIAHKLNSFVSKEDVIPQSEYKVLDTEEYTETLEEKEERRKAYLKECAEKRKQAEELEKAETVKQMKRFASIVNTIDTYMDSKANTEKAMVFTKNNLFDRPGWIGEPKDNCEEGHYIFRFNIRGRIYHEVVPNNGKGFDFSGVAQHRIDVRNMPTDNSQLVWPTAFSFEDAIAASCCLDTLQKAKEQEKKEKEEKALRAKTTS